MRIDTVHDDRDLAEGDRCAEEGRLHEAVSLYIGAVRMPVEQGDALPFHKAGLACETMGDLDRAAGFLEGAALLAPHTRVIAHDRARVGRKCIQEAYEATKAVIPPGEMQCSRRPEPGDPALQSFLVGRTALKGGGFEQAISYFYQALRGRPGYYTAWIGIGDAWEKLGFPYRAVAAWMRALEANPKRAEAAVRAGRVLHAQSLLAEALSWAERAATITPDYSQAWALKGTILESMRRFEEALAAYDRALRGNPRHRGALVGRCTTLIRLRRIEEAETATRVAAEVHPQDSRAWLLRAVALGHLRRWDEVLGCCDEALRLGPEEPLCWEIKGRALRLAGRHQEAASCKARAQQLTDSQLAQRWGFLRGHEPTRETPQRGTPE
jgi:tetratricopeptide (TPR) repeat protein